MCIIFLSLRIEIQKFDSKSLLKLDIKVHYNLLDVVFFSFSNLIKMLALYTENTSFDNFDKYYEYTWFP